MEFEFYPGLDSLNGDLKYVGKLPLDELKQRCRDNPYCIGFNTLGFLKYEVKPPEYLSHSNYFGSNDGIFVHRDRYLQQIGFQQQAIPVKIVNLKRRPDRKIAVQQQIDNAGITGQNIGWDCQFVEAVDGRQLTPTWELYKLFKGNDFGNRFGVIGCALSHYYLWRQLLEDNSTDYYLVLEDDVTLVDGFRNKIEALRWFMGKSEVLFFGYHMYGRNRDATTSTYLSNINLPQVAALDYNLYIGGTHCYSINKTGARKLVDYITKNGIKHGIDYVMKIHPSLDCQESQPHLGLADWVDGVHQVDSDIQNTYDGMDCSQ